MHSTHARSSIRLTPGEGREPHGVASRPRRIARAWIAAAAASATMLATGAVEAQSCGQAQWWNDYGATNWYLRGYFPMTNRALFAGYMTVRWGLCCGCGSTSTQVPFERWVSRPASLPWWNTGWQSYPVTVTADPSCFDASIAPGVCAYCLAGMTGVACLPNPTNSAVLGYYWETRRPFDFIVGVVPTAEGESAARFVVRSKGETTVLTRATGFVSLDGGVTKQAFSVDVPAGGTHEIPLPLGEGDPCTKSCTLWYSIGEFGPGGQAQWACHLPMTVPLVRDAGCRAFHAGFETQAPAVSVFGPALGGGAVVELATPGPDWSVRWTMIRSNGNPSVLLSNGVQPSGSTITGATTTRLEISGTTPQDPGLYTMWATPPGGTAQDEFVVGSVYLLYNNTDSADRWPRFTVEPSSVTLPEGATSAHLAFSVGGDPAWASFYPLGQWFVDDVPVDDGPHVTESGISMWIEGANFLYRGDKALDLSGIEFPKGMADRTIRVRCELVGGALSSGEARATSFERTVTGRGGVAGPARCRRCAAGLPAA
ncbi:MAG: hypothetical protein ACKO3W_01380, partial [bacterium]